MTLSAAARALRITPQAMSKAYRAGRLVGAVKVVGGKPYVTSLELAASKMDRGRAKPVPRKVEDQERPDDDGFTDAELADGAMVFVRWILVTAIHVYLEHLGGNRRAAASDLAQQICDRVDADWPESTRVKAHDQIRELVDDAVDFFYGTDELK